MWLGAQLIFLVVEPAAKRAPLPVWAFAWDVLSRVQRFIVAPACAVATLTGIVLSMQYAQRGFDMGSSWLIIMQVIGLVAAVLTFALVTPWVNRMAYLAARSVETGALDPRAEPVRKRVSLAASIAVLLILITTWFAAAKP